MNSIKKILVKLIQYLFNDLREPKFIIFEKLYLIFIANKKKCKNNIDQLINDGFFKPEINCKDEVEKINENILKKNPFKGSRNIFEYDIDNDTKKIIRELFNEKLYETISKISKVYNQKIFISNIYIKRNYGFNEITEKKLKKKEDEHFNNYFHYDGNTCNFFKMFINLHDTFENQGPLNFFSKSNSKRFIKESNYTSRLNYNHIEKINYLNINTGKKGDMLFVNTTNCLHRASVPEPDKYRDMLFISFIATNKLKSNDLFELEKQNENFWKHYAACKFVKENSKPKTFKQTMKIFFDLNKNKLSKTNLNNSIN